MQKCNLFRADLFVENNVGTDTQYNELLSQINLAKLQNTNAVSNSNAGCWRSEAQYTNIDWLIIEIKKLLDEFVKEYRQDLEYKNLDFNKVGYFYWTNINQPHSRNARHAHVKSHFSAIYYLQGTSTGPLRLINPGNSLSECDSNSPYIADVIYPPNDRDLIMWPGWVPHEVDTNLSDKERINIVFDIKFGEK
jgi:uncharacterized protein (TIGR02466 family)